MLLYRYLSQKNVKKFQEKGILRISPFHKYHDTGDSREDIMEGFKILRLEYTGTLTREESKRIFNRDNEITLGAGGAIDYRVALPKGFLISTSCTLSNQLMNYFNCDDYFTITNIPIFIKAIHRAITKKLKGASKVIFIKHDLVKYVPDKRKFVFKIDELRKMGPLNTWTIEDYFIKNENPHIIEDEYRLVFLIDNMDNFNEPLHIKLTPREISECSLLTS